MLGSQAPGILDGGMHCRGCKIVGWGTIVVLRCPQKGMRCTAQCVSRGMLSWELIALAVAAVQCVEAGKMLLAIH